ncbi:MAG: transglycosylase SLT domain-containing protein [Xanthomonadaceae bacterium]|nr:transglycosylase SLT domain-containing protein [Xanthomonadaceae bacterium]
MSYGGRWVVRWVLAGVLGLILLAVAGMIQTASAAGAGGAARAPSIPERSFLYRFKLEREAQAVFGIDAPVARLAAQIHQESRWRPDAESPVGAAGLTQFMPATAAWLPTICPTVGPPDPLDPDWAIRAMICYDAWLHSRVQGAASECDRWAFTLSAYNGGESWVRRDRARTQRGGADPSRWFGNVEYNSPRSIAAWKENREYVRRILLVLEPLYIRAGWAGKAVCS